MVTQHQHPELASQVAEALAEELKYQFEHTNAMIAGMATKANIKRLEDKIDKLSGRI